jgi:putative transposase
MTMNQFTLAPQITSVFGFEVGPFFRINGRLCKVLLQQTDKCLFQPLEGSSKPIEMTLKELLTSFANETFKSLSGPELNALLGIRTGTRATGYLNEAANESSPEAKYALRKNLKNYPVAVFRQYFVLEFISYPGVRRTRNQREAEVKIAFDKARQDAEVPRRFIQKAEPPTIASVYKWVNDWDPELGVLSLIPNWGNCGRKPQEIDDVYLDIIQQRINWMKKTANATRRGTIAIILNDIDEASKKVPHLRGKRIPSKKHIYREFRLLGGETRMAMEKGKITAHRAFSPVGLGLVVERPMERVEIDSTRLDVVPLDLLGKTILPRPWLTLMLDAKTRMILAFELSLTAPNSNDIRRVIRKAILPKNHDILRAMGVESPWPGCGLISTLVTDEAMEYTAAGSRAAYAAAGIQHKPMPPRSPHLKARVERLFRTLNEMGIHELPGTTKSNPKDRGERNPDKDKLLKIDEIEACITKLICDVYNRHYHRALGCSPLVAWERETDKNPVNVNIPKELIRRLTLDKKVRTVSHSGIELYGIRYNSEALADIHRAAGKRVKVTVNYDPFDMSEIEVEVPNSHDVIMVRCVNPDHSGLDLKVHLLIRKYAKSESRPEDAEIYRRERAKFAEYAGLLSGPRTAAMRPKGFKMLRNDPSSIGTEPVEASKTSKSRPKSPRHDASPAPADAKVSEREPQDLGSELPEFAEDPV